MFTIHSIGDSAFLEQILIAIAMVTNTGDFTRMVSSGLLLGVLIMAFQSVFRGGQTIPFQQILVCWIIYACMFSPKATTLIEDAYTGEVRVVADVPLGVAGAGSIISNVGYSITKLFETGYAIISPAVTTNHFADSLKLINDVRKGMADPAIFSAINSELGAQADLRTSLHNYIQECTLVKLDRGETSAEQLFTSDTMSALRFTSDIYGTTIYDGTPDGANVTCTEGFDRIENMLTLLTTPEVQRAISAIMRDNDVFSSTVSHLGTAMMALGVGMTDAQNYMKLSLIEPVYHEAAAGKYRDFRDFTSSMMVNQAIQQRNTQWAAESSMFMSIVRPMLTFIEGFVYAITPFMAFLIVLGGFGIQLATKYGQMLLWTQLWMPVLAIVNLFLHMAASREMASYGMETSGINTFYNLTRASDIVENWIATGGMLAAATPILTLILVSGSSYAMTSLAGRMQGGDHINEKMTTPDAASNDAVLKNMPMDVRDSNMGQRGFNAESTVGSFDLSSQVSANTSSAEASLMQASKQFTSQLGSAVQETAGTRQGQALANTIAGNLVSSGGQGSETVMAASQRLASDMGFSGSEGHQVANQLAASAMANVGFSIKGNGIGAGLSIGSTDANTNTFTISSSELQSYMRGDTLSEKQMSALQNSVAEGFTSSASQEAVHSLGLTNSESLIESATETAQSSAVYTEMASLSNSIGSSESYNRAQLAQFLMNPQTDSQRAAAERLNAEVPYLNDKQKAEVDEQLGVLQSQGFNESNALGIARLTALANPANYDNDVERLRGVSAAAEIAGGAMGRNFGAGELPNASRHAGLQDTSPSFDQRYVQQAVQSNTQRPTSPGSMEQVVSQATSGITDAHRDQALDTAFGPASNTINDANDKNTGAVTQADENNVRAMNFSNFERSEAQLQHNAKSISTEQSRALEQVVASLGGGRSGGASLGVNERQAAAQIAALSGEERAQLIRDLDSGTPMSDVLNSLGNGLINRGASNANPEIAEAILRTEDGDYSSVGNVNPQALQAINENREHQRQASEMSLTGLLGRLTGQDQSPPSQVEQAHNEQLFAARFENYKNLNLSEAETGIVAALGTGSAQQSFLSHYSDKLVQEQEQLLQSMGIDDPDRARRNADNIATALIGNVVSNGSSEVPLDTVRGLSAAAHGAVSGLRDSQPETQTVDPSSYPRQAVNYGAINSQSNDDAPTHGNSQHTPLPLPPETRGVDPIPPSNTSVTPTDMPLPSIDVQSAEPQSLPQRIRGFFVSDAGANAEIPAGTTFQPVENTSTANQSMHSIQATPSEPGNDPISQGAPPVQRSTRAPSRDNESDPIEPRSTSGPRKPEF